MSKNIDVQAHVKRYEQTDLSDVVKLKDALGALIERRTGDTIAELEQKLSLLKSGEVPEPDPKPAAPKRTRGGKKVTTEPEEA